MKILTALLISALTLTLSFNAVGAEDSDYQRYQKKADTYYQEENYAKAFRSYKDLARKGDNFSQYRLSSMYLYGQGVKRDIFEAYAWATLTTQNKKADLIEYRDQIFKAIPEADHAKAAKIAEKTMDRYGNRALATKAMKNAQRRMRSCTGSRLGSSCDAVHTGTMPNYIGMAPGNGASGETGRSVASGSAGNAGEAGNMGSGVAGRDTEYYLGLRETIRKLDRYLKENTGTVELGEFELLDDPAPATNDNSGDS
jgi:hypothetical protein